MRVCVVSIPGMSSLLTTCDSVDIQKCINRIASSFWLAGKLGLKVVRLEKQ